MNINAKESEKINAACAELKELLAKRTRTDSCDWHLTFRAREAMQVVFEDVRKIHGDGSVILQPFTCSTVPEAVIASGMKLCYADINTETLSIDRESLSSCHDAETDKNALAVIMQHTFGIIDDAKAAEMRCAADSAGLLLVEDCAHCAGRMAMGSDGQPLADVSVHSFGVEKILPTQFGAAVWISPEMKDRKLYDAMTDHFRSLPATDANASASVSTYITRFRILSHLPAAVKDPLRRHWIRTHRFIPAVAAEELAGRTILEPSVPGDEVITPCLDAFRNIGDNESRRKAAVGSYRQAFTDVTSAFTVPASAVKGDAQPLLCFPLVCSCNEDAMKLHSALNGAGIYNSTWGRPLLFPGVTDDEVFGFDDAVSTCPVCKACSDGIVLLPTNKDPQQVSDIINIIKSSL